MLVGCASTLLYVPGVSSDPRKAVIHLKRESGIVGAAVSDIFEDVAEGSDDEWLESLG